MHNPSDRRGRRGKIVTTAGHGILYGKEEDPAPAICHNKDESSGTVLANTARGKKKSKLCDTSYIKFKNGQKQSAMLEVQLVGPW